MGWLGRIFGSRKRREQRRETEERLRAALEADGADATWPALVEALREDPDSDELYRLASHALRLAGAPRLAVFFDRAADAPHDAQRLFELGSELLSEDEPDAAVAVLERALALAPFDAVARSELALAHARRGDPDKVLATLALHPCLADDPGALFELAWASLLKGDLDTAEDAARELHGAPQLRHKLELAIDRGRASGPARDARDFYFVEHGGVLVDATGALAGRHDALTVDADWLGTTLRDAGAVVERLLPRPRRILALDAAHRPLAEALAATCDGTVLEPGRGRLPAAVLPLWDGSLVESRLDAASLKAEGIWLFALTVDHRASLARAPEIVGAFTREATLADGLAPEASDKPPSSTLLDYVDHRRDYLPPRGDRVRAAYVPDAPLPK